MEVGTFSTCLMQFQTQNPIFCPRLALECHHSPHIFDKMCLQTTLSDFIAPIQISVIPSLKVLLPDSPNIAIDLIHEYGGLLPRS
jgi:hypothetical protein